MTAPRYKETVIFHSLVGSVRVVAFTPLARVADALVDVDPAVGSVEAVVAAAAVRVPVRDAVAVVAGVASAVVNLGAMDTWEKVTLFSHLN
jgi:hypothetical protein